LALDQSFDGIKQDKAEMSFLEHIEELRLRLIYVGLGIVVGMIISFFVLDFVVTEILLRPAREVNLVLQNLRPFGQFTLYFEVAFTLGLILSIPNVVYQFWKFIEPALGMGERKYIKFIVFFTTFSFLAGMVFAYYLILPATLGVAVTIGTDQIKNEFAVDEYLSIVYSVTLATATIFELPMLSYALAKIGILKPEYMTKYRRHAIVILFIVAAVLTPPDPVSQSIMVVPLILLYELSIIIVKRVKANRENSES